MQDLRLLHEGSVVAAWSSDPAACGTLVSPSGIEPASPALEGGFLTTGPLGKPWPYSSDTSQLPYRVHSPFPVSSFLLTQCFQVLIFFLSLGKTPLIFLLVTILWWKQYIVGKSARLLQQGTEFQSWLSFLHFTKRAPRQRLLNPKKHIINAEPSGLLKEDISSLRVPSRCLPNSTFYLFNSVW